MSKWPLCILMTSVINMSLLLLKTDIQFSFTLGYVFGSWRVFMLICTVPIIFSLLGLLIMPESPRYLLQVRTTEFKELPSCAKIPTFSKIQMGIVYEIKL